MGPLTQVWIYLTFKLSCDANPDVFSTCLFRVLCLHVGNHGQLYSRSHKVAALPLFVPLADLPRLGSEVTTGLYQQLLIAWSTPFFQHQGVGGWGGAARRTCQRGKRKLQGCCVLNQSVNIENSIADCVKTRAQTMHRFDTWFESYHRDCVLGQTGAGCRSVEQTFVWSESCRATEPWLRAATICFLFLLFCWTCSKIQNKNYFFFLSAYWFSLSSTSDVFAHNACAGAKDVLRLASSAAWLESHSEVLIMLLR